MNPELSIIIPHFNSSKLLEKLLLSIPQDKNIQIIIIDDKSEKNHVDYIEGLLDSYIFEFYVNDSIKSAGTCRNLGLSKAKGKWILFADADDYFVEDFYELIKDYFKSKSDVVFFLPTSIYIDTGKLANRHSSFKNKLKKYLNNKTKVNELNIRYGIHNPICKMIRKSFIDNYEIKFDQVIAANDSMFSTKVGHFMNKFEVSNQIIYCITQNKGSLTVNKNENVFWSRLKVNVKYIIFLKKKLSKNELNILKPKALGYIINSFDYGLLTFFKVMKYYHQYNIKWFYWSYLNPIVFCKRLLNRVLNRIKSKKYHIKQK